VVVSGKGTPEDETNAKMVLRFPFTPPEQYWVVRLDAEYSYVAICDGNYNGLWIMSRGKTMDEAVYASLVKSLASDGFPVDKLVRTTQNI
jgi:apolipoprotein D and lipocalin family protein